MEKVILCTPKTEEGWSGYYKSDKVNLKIVLPQIKEKCHNDETVPQKDITIRNMCAPNHRASIYMKQKWTKSQEILILFFS